MLRKLDLRSGRPIWESYRAPTVPTAPLSHDVTTEILIIGMGISGAMMAETLTARGYDIVCIDRRGPLKGSTAATTALVQFETDQPMTSLAAMIGRASTEQAWRRSRLAVSNLKARIEELGIACDLRETPSLYIAGNQLGPTQLREEALARTQAGIHASYLSHKPLLEAFGIDRGAAILSQGNLALDPRKLTAGLFLKASQRKARFYAPSEAKTLTQSGEAVIVQTADGPTITAQHVILATGYELVEMVPSAAHQIISTWAIATKPQKQAVWPQGCFIWEASDPYLYMRVTHDNRVICGGEDEEFRDEDRRNVLMPAKAKRIADKLKALFPQLDTAPEFTWTGSFGTTTTGLPYIGSLPHRPRIHSVMGYGGNGITFSQIASEIIAATIAGGEDCDAKLFAFNR